MLTQSAPLFKEIPIGFFRPLSGRFAPLYWVILERLYQLDFEGEPFEITQDVAVEQCAQLIEQSPDFSESPDRFRHELEEELREDVPDSKPGTEQGSGIEEREARSLARRLLKRLERQGWFDYEYRESSKGYILNFRDYAARILHTLSQIANQEQPVFEGLAQSIKTALAPQELSEKPGVAVYNAQKSTKDLVREIKILSRNIHRYADRAIREAQTSKDLLELQLDIYHTKVVDASYHRFKTTDNIFKYRTFILRQLDFFEDDAALQGSAVQWISKNQGLNYADANGLLDEWIGTIRQQIGSVHLLTDDLDRKNARYTATTLQKINYLLNQERDLEGKLVRLLKKIDEAEMSDFSAVPSPFECFRVEFFDSQSLYQRPKDKAALEPIAVEVPALSSEMKEKLFKKTREGLQRQFSRSKVHEAAQALLQGRGIVPIQGLDLKNAEDFVRMIFLVAHGRDRRAPYRFDASPNAKERFLELGEFGRFRVRPGEFLWKEKMQGENS